MSCFNNNNNDNEIIEYPSYNKNIYIQRSSLKIKDIKEMNVNWERNCLHIPDAYGGPSRSVEIDSYILNEKIYLNTVSQLKKKEFEQLFGFKCGEFKVGKIISIPLNNVTIY